MKSLVCSMLVLAAAGLLALGGNSPAAPMPAVASIADSSLQTADSLAALKCDNPLCDCEKCACTDCASCAPLEVGQPPDLVNVVHLTNPPKIDASLNSLKAAPEPKFTEPPPGLVVPVVHPAPKPVAKAADPAAGHWVMQQSCGRGGCSLQRVWVPNAPQAAAPVYQQQSACGPGGCGVRRGLFGRRR